ncbi:MAG: DEAD/DEAH box helicase family protein [Nitrososphaeraceae archaeon]
MATLPYQRHRQQQQQKGTSATRILSSSSNFQILANKPFWIWDQDEHRAQFLKKEGKCCFNHIIGLPVKDKKEHPLYDYEKLLFDQLFTNNGSFTFKDKHLWVLKSTGLGITEFFLRVIGWLCVKDDSLKGSQICIVTGPRVELSITLIDRLKAIFYNRLGIIFSNKETVLELNGVKIEVYPSHHLDAMRGLANVSFILLDEADFFPPGQQQDARDISERYIGKSNPFIVMASTPSAPNSLFYRIEHETEQECIYQRLKLDYTYGLDKIYSKEEIEKQKQSPSVKREYDLQYLGLIGNTFHIKDIDRAMSLVKDTIPIG